MPIYRLSHLLLFPPVDHAEDGVLAVGGDLSVSRLLLAYRQGIFPWYHEGLPIIWHSPDPRCVLRIDALHVSRSLRKVLRKKPLEIRVDTAFADVLEGCKQAYRPGQDGTWITEEMQEAYGELHRQGYAHSFEVWEGDELVGGLYGVSLGRMFFGESMFSRRPNASKIALVGLVQVLRGWGYGVIDCQVANEHTVSLGAEEWPREVYLGILAAELKLPTRRGRWELAPFHPEPPAGNE